MLNFKLAGGFHADIQILYKQLLNIKKKIRSAIQYIFIRQQIKKPVTKLICNRLDFKFGFYF